MRCPTTPGRRAGTDRAWRPLTDILTAISGVEFDDAWASKVELVVDGVPLPFLGRDALIRNKLAAARPKDLADVAALRDEA